MRIALVALTCPSGGMAHYASQLANALAPLGAVHLFAPHNPDLGRYLAPGVVWHELPVLSRPHETLANVCRQLNPLAHMAIAARVRAAEPDVLHFVTDHPCNGLVSRLLGHLPQILTCHDPLRHAGEAHGLKQALQDAMAARCARVIVHAEALRAPLEQRGVTRLSVIPHGDYGFLRALVGQEPEQPEILCFGRIVAYKGLDDLCRAERSLRSWLDAYTVVIAGEGDRRVFDHAMGPDARIEVRDHFHSDADTARLFARARVVVLPYVEASQSGVAAIAFAFGKPLVVTQVGGLPEAVGHGEAGVIVPPRSPEALARAIASLWHDAPRRARLGRAGQERIERTIGWRHVARQHMAVYQEAVA